MLYSLGHPIASPKTGGKLLQINPFKPGLISFKR